MKTSVETLEPVKVKLTVEVEPQRIKQVMDRAAKKIAAGVQMPGFRKGKVPRRLLEQRFGLEAIAQQAMDDNLGIFYSEGLRAEELIPVAQPEIEIDVFDEVEGCRFTAEIEVAPDFELPDHTGLNLLHPEWDVTDEAVDGQLQALRERFAEVDEVERSAAKGDYVTLDLVVVIDGEELTDAGVTDALYEVGSTGVTPKLDEELVGKQAGDEFIYTDTLPDGFREHPGAEAEFRIKVTDVREKTLPELDDDFASTASEFDTLAELVKSVRDRLLARRIAEARQVLRDLALEAYLAQVDIPLPPSLVEDHIASRKSVVARQAQQFGMEIDALLQAQGSDPEAFDDELAEQARLTVKGQLVLDKLAGELDLEVTAEDLDREIYRHAQMQGTTPTQVAQNIQAQNLVGMLVGDALRRRTIDAILDAADLEGGPSDEVLIEVGLLPDPNELDADADADADADLADDRDAADTAAADTAAADTDDPAGDVAAPMQA